MVKLRNIRLSKFCFCCDLQKGVIGVGIWSGLLCFIILLFHTYLIIKYSMVDDEKLVLAKKNELKCNYNFSYLFRTSLMLFIYLNCRSINRIENLYWIRRGCLVFFNFITYWNG